MKVTQAIRAHGPCTAILNTDLGGLYLTPAKPAALVQGWTLDPTGQGQTVAIYPDEDTVEQMENLTDDPVLVELARRCVFVQEGEAIPVPTASEAKTAGALYVLEGTEIKKKNV